MLLFIVSFPVALIMILVTSIRVLVLALLQLDGLLLLLGSLLILNHFSAIGIFYLTAILPARAVFAFGLGRLVLQFAAGREAARHRPRLSLLTGVVLLVSLASLPELRFLGNALALFMGLGAIASAVTKWLHAFRDKAFQRQANPVSRQNTFDTQCRPIHGSDEVTAYASHVPAALQPRYAGPAGLDDLPADFDPVSFFSDD